MAAERSDVDNYDVFINFRGADTRHGFAYRLYDALVAEGMRVFLDDEELNPGKRFDEELLQAINNSKIYITIISKKYASSKWCLRELAEIVRNKQEFKDKKEILPVFYKVTLEDVKLRTDLFKEQLISLEKMVPAETVKAWTEALTGIPNLQAWTVPTDGGYKQDGECCRDIVKRVSIILRVKHKQLPKDLIGMEDPVEEVMQLLDIGNLGFQVIGIHGMGGSGKTTLTKAVYNKICDKFDSCCFLPDVRESLDNDRGSRGCLELQKKLLKEVSYGGDVDEIREVEDAVSKIQLTLQGKKVLMVFDDVSKADQILRLICNDGDTDMLNGSRGRIIIITTRDDRVLRNREFAGFTKIHKMKAMENEHALELFSWHAFGEPMPPADYVELSKDAVSLTGRLPLSLEITGSLFFIGGRKNWKQTVEKLKKMPNKEVQERLKISYEDLEEQTREIFLDIACFFVDKEVSHEAAMWASCEFYPELAIEELISMCLVKIDEDSIYRMHDHIKDLGRDIVRQEGPKDLEQRSRIWMKQDSINILESRKKENNKIEGINLEDLKLTEIDDEIWTLRAENFVNLDKLRFLRVANRSFEMQVEGSFEHLLPNLRWLSLQHMKIMRFNVTNFNLKKLVVLNLSGTNITESWAGWKEFKVPNSTGAGLVNLECLSLRWCESLKSLPNSVTSLPKLRHLDLSNCWNLEKLPDSIGELAELEVLLLEDCKGLVSLPNSLTSLPKLHFLNLEGCKSLESLPDSVGETMVLQLTELDISWCVSLKKLAGFISKQKKLEVLLAVETIMLGGDLTEIEELTCLREIDFNESNICGLPSLVKLTRLEKLSLRDCYDLQQLPAELPTSLVELHVRTESLQSIPDYSYLIHLTKLTFVLYELGGDLGELQELNLSWIWRLSKLKNIELDIWGNYTTTIESEESSSVSLLPQLEELTLRCSILGTCFVMPSFLSALTISLYRGTTSLSLARLNRLTHFKLSESCDLAHILGLGELESLISLKISECDSLERLDDISKLTQLQTLKITECDNLRVIPGVPGLLSLKKLEIRRCESLESLVGPSESESCLYDILRVIKSWNISRCPLLKNKLPDDLKRRMEDGGGRMMVLMAREWVSEEECTAQKTATESPTPTWSYPQQTRDFLAALEVNFAQGQSPNLHDIDRCIDQVTGDPANLSISEPPSTDQLFIGGSSGLPVFSSGSSTLSTPTHTFQFKSMEKELQTTQRTMMSKDMDRSGLIEFTSANQVSTALETVMESQPPLSGLLVPAPMASLNYPDGSGREQRRRINVHRYKANQVSTALETVMESQPPLSGLLVPAPMASLNYPDGSDREQRRRIKVQRHKEFNTNQACTALTTATVLESEPESEEWLGWLDLDSEEDKEAARFESGRWLVTTHSQIKIRNRITEECRRKKHDSKMIDSS